MDQLTVGALNSGCSRSSYKKAAVLREGWSYKGLVKQNKRVICVYAQLPGYNVAPVSQFRLV